jgi:hypothetical protein
MLPSEKTVRWTSTVALGIRAIKPSSGSQASRYFAIAASVSPFFERT